uniref:Cyclin N-terminal domain-containing protein n=1 Tax=Ascaris lumbricoides TaxID=6252 RepID=A0A0M3IH30_ASCLU
MRCSQLLGTQLVLESPVISFYAFRTKFCKKRNIASSFLCVHNPYALKYAFVLANLCEERINVDIVIHKMLQHCYDIEVTGIH